MTVLPSARVKLPVCESTSRSGVPSMDLSKPVGTVNRRAEPVVPSRTTMLVGLSPKFSAAHLPAFSLPLGSRRPYQAA